MDYLAIQTVLIRSKHSLPFVRILHTTRCQIRCHTNISLILLLSIFSHLTFKDDIFPGCVRSYTQNQRKMSGTHNFEFVREQLLKTLETQYSSGTPSFDYWMKRIEHLTSDHGLYGDVHSLKMVEDHLIAALFYLSRAHHLDEEQVSYHQNRLADLLAIKFCRSV